MQAVKRIRRLIGLGQIFVSTSIVAVSRVTPNESGLASALLNVGRQVGGSLGIAIMGTVAATAAKDQLSAGPLTHAVLSRATTAGFAAALELAGLIAVAGFVIAFVAVRRPQARVADDVPAEAA